MSRRPGPQTREQNEGPTSITPREDWTRSEKIEIKNVNHPGHVTHVDAKMYAAMRTAFLKVLPSASPGLTEAEIRGRVVSHLPQNLFPDGAKAGWWTKAVQLDLEARGIVAREKTKPLRWHKVRH